MAKKKSSKGKSSNKLALFNRTQEIYKLLEKGIIESEALLSTAADRPEDDAHVLDLLESTGSSTTQAYRSAAKRPSRKSPKGSSRRPKPAKKGRKG